MKTDALIGLIALCAIVVPSIAFFVLRRRAGMADLPARLWLTLYIVAFVAQPIFLMRKHLEGAIVTSSQSFGAVALAQIDNAWWEELAKLLAILIVVRVARERLMPLLRTLTSAIGLGFWAGLAYGAGEAVVLAILFAIPSLGPIFGMRTFTPFMFGWEFVYERFWAMQMHAIMGALIGIGLWAWTRGRRWEMVAWFVAAMLYHHLVDGAIILASFVREIALLLTQLGPLALVLFVAIGYAAVALAYRALKRNTTTSNRVDSPNLSD